jgi:hypothetical protein
MPQRVEGEPGEPRLLQERIELPVVEVIGVHRLADPVGEYKREIMRCLKRYIAREVYRVVISAVPPSPNG